jgi:glycyl-tRNA synthetase beta subunit
MMDNDKGFDLVVYTTKRLGKKFRDPEFRIDGEDSVLSSDPEKVKKILSSIKPIREVFKPMTSSELKKALDEYINFAPAEDPEKESGTTERGKVAGDPLQTSDKSTGQVVDDVEAAFETAISNARSR